MAGQIVLPEVSETPTSPAADKHKLYVDGDGELTIMDDAGDTQRVSSETSYRFVPYSEPLVSTDWAGDTKTSANDGTVDLSAVFSVPAGVKAVAVRGSINSATAGTYLQFKTVSFSTSAAIAARTQVASKTTDYAGIVPCDANGDFYIGFGGTCTVYLLIVGHFV